MNANELEKHKENLLPLDNDIQRLFVVSSEDDATSAIGCGAKLLAIAKEDNDEDGHYFRFLLGIERGLKLHPHLEFILRNL